MKILKSKQADSVRYIDAYGAQVYAFCYRLLGEAGCAEAVTQNVLAEGYASPAQKPGVDDSLWLLSRAYQRCVQTLRNEAHLISIDGSERPLDKKRLLAALPLEGRCLIIMETGCALEPEQIAAIVGLSSYEVRLRLVRARRTMAKMIVAASRAKAGPSRLVEERRQEYAAIPA